MDLWEGEWREIVVRFLVFKVEVMKLILQKMLWQEWSNFGAVRLEERSVMPYFYIDGCGGHNATAVTAKSDGCGGC